MEPESVPLTTTSIAATAAGTAPASNGDEQRQSPLPSTSSAAAAAFASNNRPPFEDSEKIYEDKNVVFQVQKKELLRQKKFSLETFRYKVTAERKIPIGGSDPEQGPKYLVDFSSAIEMTIAKLFGSLLDYYSKEKVESFDHQVYITLMAPKLNALNVGNFSLEDSDPQKIARLCTTYLYNILNSGRVVDLNIGLEGFEIDMKVRKTLGNKKCAYSSFKLKNNNLKIISFYQVLGLKHTKFQLNRARLRQKRAFNKRGQLWRLNKVSAHHINLEDTSKWDSATPAPLEASTSGNAAAPNLPQLHLDDSDGELIGATCKNPRWMLTTPMGFKKAEQIFQNCCLLVAVVLGYFNNLCNEVEPSYNPPEKKMISSFLRRPMQLNRNMGRIILNEVQYLQDRLKLPKSGPYSTEVCYRIATFLKCNIVIFNNDSPPRVYRLFPDKIDLALPTINLVMSRLASRNEGHVDLIKDLPTFFNTKGYACISCPFRSKNFNQYGHCCKKPETKSCFKCHRFLQTKTTYINKINRNLFCDSSVGKWSNTAPCDQCQLTPKTSSCLRSHKKICRYKGLWCSKCKTFETGIKQLKKPHDCKHSRLPMCLNCYERKEDNHICAWSLSKPIKNFDNLAFIKFQTSSSSATCVQCFQLQRPCQVHFKESDLEIVPICCSVVFENEVRGKFSSVTFLHPDFSELEDSVTDTFEFNYFPDNLSSFLPDKSLLTSLNVDRKAKRFNRPSAPNKMQENHLQQMRLKEVKSVAEKFVSMFIQEKYRNYTFVTSDYLEMTFVIRALLENNIRPSCPIRRASQLIKFTIDSLDIVFICGKQFISTPLMEMPNHFQMNIKPTFFPQCASTDKVMPDLSNFQLLLDSKMVLDKKAQFCEEKRNEPFSYAISLSKCSRTEVKILSLALLHYLANALEFQLSCHELFGVPWHGKKTGVLPILHPFNYTSMGAFTYESFRHFALPPNIIFSVPVKRQDSCSKIETEYTELLRHKDPGAWVTEYSSALGQKSFFSPNSKRPFLFADAYNPSSKMVILVNGCFFHAHDCGAVISKEKTVLYLKDKFNRQVKMLAQQQIQVTVVWECELLEMKKQAGSELSVFLASSKLRPYERLNFRDAFKGALLECYRLRYVQQPEAKELFFCIDVSSLYPFVATRFEMPVGR